MATPTQEFVDKVAAARTSWREPALVAGNGDTGVVFNTYREVASGQNLVQRVL